jgi:hypothetical protein
VHSYASLDQSSDAGTGLWWWAQLTARGFEQQVALGEVLRQLYVLEQGLLPRRLKEEDVWVRSTDVPRTRESALGMLLGLYPAEARVHGQTVRTWRKPMVIEDMLPNPLKCPRYEERRQELTASAEFQQRMQRTQPLRRQLERVLHTAGVSSFAADFDSYVDNLMTRACHAKPLPCDPRGGGGGGGECLTLADARAVLDEGNWQYSFMHQDEVRVWSHKRIRKGASFAALAVYPTLGMCVCVLVDLPASPPPLPLSLKPSLSAHALRSSTSSHPATFCGRSWRP